jgi:hypothetical protein
MSFSRAGRDRGWSRVACVASQGKRWDPSSLPSTLPEEHSTDVNRESFTLADMVNWGIAHPSEATDTFLDLKRELALVTKCVVMCMRRRRSVRHVVGRVSCLKGLRARVR